MSRLISRQMQIPNGFWFYQPETKWDSRKTIGMHPSFTVLTNAVVAHRLGNASVGDKTKWSTDPNTVADEIDHFCASFCQQMGWTKYIAIDAGGPPAPKSMPLSQSDLKQVSAAAGRVKKIWAGVKILSDWIDSGEPAVPQEQSTARAAVCKACTRFNGKGDFTRWFTAPAAESIRRQLEKVRDRQLATPHDEDINVCEACLCPLKLKVHTPIHFIKAHTSAEVLAEMSQNPDCWIVRELK